ncbi:MAG: hypothetical protein R3190_03005, partial [Thermoanaerobaculia bacterium]|nr:hypothetical protein [Thermoanaerobaculia bacterium]
LFDTILTRDTWMHRTDLAEATGRPLELTADHDGRIVADVVAEWARDMMRRYERCVVHCTPSMAVRVCIAAREAGIDLTGVLFRCGAEPMTEAKAATIRAAGATSIVSYSMSECGQVGSACLRPSGVNDQHLRRDHLGVIQWPRQVGDREVQALLLTSLMTTAPRVLLNVEIDDYGIVEERRCGCPLDDLGLHTHVRDVRSFKKLTAEGVTLVGSDMEHVIEEILPSRFGGSAFDYQLIEDEDDDGRTRIVIRVSPAVGEIDEEALLGAVLAGLERASVSSDLAVRLWNQTGAIRVERAEPHHGGRGKLLPLHSTRRQSAPPSRASA